MYNARKYYIHSNTGSPGNDSKYNDGYNETNNCNEHFAYFQDGKQQAYECTMLYARVCVLFVYPSSNS